MTIDLRSFFIGTLVESLANYWPGIPWELCKDVIDRYSKELNFTPLTYEELQQLKKFNPYITKRLNDLKVKKEEERHVN